VLVDGLDKVRDDEQVRDLFCSGLLSCPDTAGLDLVYAAPPSLRHQVGFGGGTGFDILRLGPFDIVRRDGTDKLPQLQSLRDMRVRRIDAAGCRADDVLPGGGRTPTPSWRCSG